MRFKVGDLIYDREHPEEGCALVIEVKEPRNRRGKWWKGVLGYRCLETLTGRIEWYTIGYIEDDCRIVEETNETR